MRLLKMVNMRSSQKMLSQNDGKTSKEIKRKVQIHPAGWKISEGSNVQNVQKCMEERNADKSMEINNNNPVIQGDRR